MVAVRTYGPMPPTAIPSVIFAHAIGLHPNLVDWWTIAPDFAAVLNGDVDSVISRKRDAQGYAGHPLVKVVSGPEYHDNQINGRAAGKFVSAGFDRLEALGILPTGSFSMSIVYDAPPRVSGIGMLAGSQNNGGVGRFGAYINQVGGVDYVTATAGSAATAAQISRPRALGRTRLIVSWDEIGHEIALMQADDAWWTATNPAAEVTQTGFAVGSFAGQGGSLDGLVADVQLWNLPLHLSANAKQLDLVRRYTAKIFGVA